MKADNNSRENGEIGCVVDEPLEPGAEGGLHELDPRDHAVHFVEEPRDEEEQGACDIGCVGASSEIKRAEDCDPEASECYFVRGYSRTGKKTHEGSAKTAV